MLSPNIILQNRYRVIRQLGQGGMGTVYEALDQRVNAVIALKETLVDPNEASQHAFEREAGLLANLRHHALPKVMDYFTEDEGEFLVMEFIPGYDLAELLELRGSPFEVNQVLRWADVLLGVLEYLHGLNPPVLHRDIKPSNLKLTKQGEIYLLDFGLAKGTVGQMPTMLTSRSVRGYTPVYAPLEQIHGMGTDARSDLYSLGATLYHLLTATRPVDAPTRFDAVEDDRPDPQRPIEELNPQVPAAIAAPVHQAMAVSRKQRPASAAEMRKALRQAEEAMRRAAAAEEDERRRQEAEEQERQKREAEEAAALKLAAEREAVRLAAEEKARAAAEAEQARKRAAEIERKRREEQERQRRAEAEKQRRAEEAEASRKRAEELKTNEAATRQTHKEKTPVESKAQALPLAQPQAKRSEPQDVLSLITSEEPADWMRSKRALYTLIGAVVLIASLSILYLYTRRANPSVGEPPLNATSDNVNSSPQPSPTPTPALGNVNDIFKESDEAASNGSQTSPNTNAVSTANRTRGKFKESDEAASNYSQTSPNTNAVSTANSTRGQTQNSAAINANGNRKANSNSGFMDKAKEIYKKSPCAGKRC